ncbi:MAG: hypothetical protein QJR00_02980 [Bacillota bacterium]|nr:hypothetical protein [Bacillota bacterium]
MDLREVLDGAITDFQWWIQHRLSGLRGKLQRPAKGKAWSQNLQERILPREGGGPVLLAADSRLSDPLTLRLLHLARGRGSRVMVVAGMDVSFAPPARHIARQLNRFGVEKISALALVTRTDAEDPRRWDGLLESDLVIVAGQDPEQGALLGSDSSFTTALQAAYRQGTPIAFLGGAASLAGGWLAARDGETPAPGWGLLPSFAIAGAASHGSHFLTWVQSLSRAPRALRWGLWLETGTAALVGDGMIEPLGKPGCLLLPLSQFRAAAGTPSEGKAQEFHLLPPGLPWRLGPPGGSTDAPQRDDALAAKR